MEDKIYSVLEKYGIDEPKASAITEDLLFLCAVVKSLPSKEAMTNEIKAQTDLGETKDDLAYKSIFADGFKQCYYWLRHELTK